MLGCDLIHSGFFLQVLSHGMNRDVSLACRQGHSFKSSPGFNQIRYRAPLAGKDEPTVSLTGECGCLVDTLPANSGFHKILGLNKISDEPAFETANLHTFNSQLISITIGILVTEPHPLDQFPLGVIPLSLDTEIFNAFFDSNVI